MILLWYILVFLVIVVIILYITNSNYVIVGAIAVCCVGAYMFFNKAYNTEYICPPATSDTVVICMNDYVIDSLKQEIETLNKMFSESNKKVKEFEKYLNICEDEKYVVVNEKENFKNNYLTLKDSLSSAAIFEYAFPDSLLNLRDTSKISLKIDNNILTVHTNIDFHMRIRNIAGGMEKQIIISKGRNEIYITDCRNGVLFAEMFLLYHNQETERIINLKK